MIPWKEYFTKPNGPQTSGMIIAWWEIRRLYYNLVVFVAIVLTSLVMPAFVRGPLASSDSTYLMSLRYHILFSFLILQIPANIGYTGGWVADLLIKKVLRRPAPGFGPWAQAIGIVFSLILTVFLMTVIWTWHV